MILFDHLLAKLAKFVIHNETLVRQGNLLRRMVKHSIFFYEFLLLSVPLRDLLSISVVKSLLGCVIRWIVKKCFQMRKFLVKGFSML